MAGTAIIDIDSYLYKASLTCGELVELGDGMYYEAYNLNNAIGYLREFAHNMMDATNTDDYVFVTGGVGRNFRYTINPLYKSNRKQQKKPIMLDIVRDKCFHMFPVMYTPCLEADDTCRILYEQDRDNVIVSLDKDLKTFESKIYDPLHCKMNYTSRVQAEANFKRQLLMGDATDGYSGIPKVGKATADKLILSGITIDEIAEKYIDAGLTIDDFKLTYNCAKIIGKDDYHDGIITLYGGETLDTKA